MDTYTYDFCELMTEKGAFRAGSEQCHAKTDNFETCSTIARPFTVEMDNLSSGYSLKKLSDTYVDAICECFGLEFNVIFGSAIRCSPLAMMVTMRLWERYSYAANFCSLYRSGCGKMVGYHALGHTPQNGDRVLIIKDTASPRSVRSVGKLISNLKSQADIEVVGLMVGFDFMEVRQDKTKTLTALDEIATEHNIKTHALASMRDMLEYLRGRNELPADTENAIRQHYATYGPDWLAYDSRWHSCSNH